MFDAWTLYRLRFPPGKKREQVRRGRTASLHPCVNRHCLFCSDRNCFDSLQCVKSNIGGKDEAAALIEQLFSTHQSFTEDFSSGLRHRSNSASIAMVIIGRRRGELVIPSAANLRSPERGTAGTAGRRLHSRPGAAEAQEVQIRSMRI
jgi:hypothetical protein